jgi:hypothetical protein
MLSGVEGVRRRVVSYDVCFLEFEVVSVLLNSSCEQRRRRTYLYLVDNSTKQRFILFVTG